MLCTPMYNTIWLNCQAFFLFLTNFSSYRALYPHHQSHAAKTTKAFITVCRCSRTKYTAFHKTSVLAPTVVLSGIWRWKRNRFCARDIAHIFLCIGQVGLTSSHCLKILPGPGGKAQQKIALGDQDGVVQVTENSSRRSGWSSSGNRKEL